MDSPSFNESFLPALGISLLAGNVLGLLEVLYIYFELRTLAVAGPLHFLQYLAGGAFVYGVIFLLFFGGTLVLLGILTFYEIRRAPLQRLIGLTLAVMSGVFVFAVTTYLVYYDIPGLVESLRFKKVWFLSLSFALVVYVLVRFLPVSFYLTRKMHQKIIRRFLLPLVAFNLLCLFLGTPVAYAELPNPDRVRTNATGHPPVIYIGVDTLRADHLSVYDDSLPYTTPAAETLAEDGVTFLNHSAQWPKTTPSFASIFTSLYPAEIPIYANSQPIPEERQTWAEILRSEGYYTLGIVSSFAVHEKFLGQGFDFYLNREDWGLKNMKILRYLLPHTGGAMPTSFARRFLHQDTPQPFFMFLHYIVPHAPYHPPYPYSVNYDPGYNGFASGDMRALDAIRNDRAYRNSRDLSHVRSLYDGEVAYTDRQILRFLRSLKETGLYEKALIILGSDHGETMDQHGPEHFFRHGTLHRSDLDVPLIVKLPDQRFAGTKIRRTTSNRNILATVLDVLNVTAGTVETESLLATHTDKQEDNAVFAQTKRSVSLRKSNWKGIYRFPQETFELYNLEEDPGETTDVSSRNETRSRTFRNRLETFAETSYRDAPAKQLTPKTRRRLEGLGYLD